MSCFNSNNNNYCYLYAFPYIYPSIANDINEKLFRQQIICDGERESFIVDAYIVYLCTVIRTAIHSTADEKRIFAKKVRSKFRLVLVEYFHVVVRWNGIRTLTRSMLELMLFMLCLLLCCPDSFVLFLAFCYLFAHSIVLASFFFTLWLLLSRRCELNVEYTHKKVNISSIFDYCARLSYHRINVFCIYLLRRFPQSPHHLFAHCFSLLEFQLSRLLSCIAVYVSYFLKGYMYAVCNHGVNSESNKKTKIVPTIRINKRYSHRASTAAKKNHAD